MGDIFFLVIFLPSLEFITVAHIMLEVLCTHLRKVLNNMFTLDVAWEVGKNLTHFFWQMVVTVTAVVSKI